MTNDKGAASGHGEHERIRREPWDSLADWDRPVPHPGPANSGEIGPAPWADDEPEAGRWFFILCVLVGLGGIAGLGIFIIVWALTT